MNAEDAVAAIRDDEKSGDKGRKEDERRGQKRERLDRRTAEVNRRRERQKYSDGKIHSPCYAY